MARQLGTAAVLVTILGGVLVPTTAVAQAAPGPAPAPPTACMTTDTLVSDGYSGPGLGGEILRVNPVSQSTLTTNTSPAGTPDLDEPTDMAYLPGGDIVVTDEGLFSGVPQVVQVNPNTGARTLVSSATRGTGPALVLPTSVAVTGGDILVSDLNPTTYLPRVLQVNAATGDRTVLSGNGVGTGPTLVNTAPLTVGVVDGVIYVANGAQLMSVAPSNGNRTLISSPTRGAGPTIVWPLSLADAASANSLVVLDERQPSGTSLGDGALITIDLASGDRTVLSSNGNPAGGQPIVGPYDMAYDSCANVYYVVVPGSVSSPPGQVLEVDGTTGGRTLYASFRGARNWSILLHVVAPPPWYPGGGGGHDD
jgi:hypothetical protein